MASDLTNVGVSEGTPIVFWDGYGLDDPYSGIGKYALSLHKELLSLGVSPLVVGGRDLKNLYSDSAVVSAILSNAHRLKLLWPNLVYRKINSHQLPSEQRRIYHGLSNINLPMIGQRRKTDRFLLTVHDLIPFYDNANVSMAYRKQFRFMLKRAIPRADCVIAVSHWTANELRSHFPRYQDKIVVIPNGRPEILEGVTWFGENAQSDIIKILTVSRSEGYKRLPLIGEILNRSADIHATIVTDLAGKKKLIADYFHLIQLGKVHIRVGVGDDELNRMFQETDIYVHPSLYEGFCLPAAEALASGKPVIYTRGSGIDEVCGVEVCTGIEAEASALEWKDAILKKFQQLTDKQSKARILAHCRSLPSWKSSAEALKKLYNSIGTGEGIAQ